MHYALLVPTVTLLLVTDRTFLLIDSLLRCPGNLLAVILGDLTALPWRWRVGRLSWRSVGLPGGPKEGTDN